MSQYTYTASEYTDMILIYGECHGNAALAIRTYKERYGAKRHCPSRGTTIYNAMQRIRDNKTLIPKIEGTGRRISRRREEKILDYFERNPKASLRKAAHQFRIAHSCVHKVLKEEKRKSFKMLKAPGILSKHKSIKEGFCSWLLKNHEDNPDFLFNIMWTDESRFAKNGLWNQGNVRHWGCKNPNQVLDTNVDRFSVTVWAGVHTDNIIGPVFVDGTLNAQNYMDILQGPVAEYTEQISLQEHSELWFQLNGSPPHSVPCARDCIAEMFGQQWIGRYGPIKFPAKSPDLTPLGIFLWDSLKDEVYSKEPETVDDLKDQIINALDKLKIHAKKQNILADMREKIVKRCNLLVANE